MKRAFRFSVYSGRFSRANDYPSEATRGRVALPRGCFVASLLAVTIPPDRRPLVGGSQRWRNKGALQAFFQTSPKVACFAPSFSKEFFGDFVRFQRVTRFQTSFDFFQIFPLRPPLFGRILDAAGPHSAASLGARPAVRVIL